MSDHWRETSPGDVADIVMGQYPPIPSLPVPSPLKGEGELEGVWNAAALDGVAWAGLR